MARRTRTITLPGRYPAPTLRPGMRVVYSRYFLACTGTPTDDRWRWEGTVVDVLGHLAHVAWDGDEGPPWMVAIVNLARPMTPGACD